MLKRHSETHSETRFCTSKFAQDWFFSGEGENPRF